MLHRNLFGIQVILDDRIPAPIEKQYQRRTHHRSRINKKWLKRFGMVTIYGPAAVQFAGGLIVNTPMLQKLREARLGDHADGKAF